MSIYWLRTADVPRGDRSVYEHECLSRILESMVVVDQLNIPALQSAELICRRLQVIREAHRISPSQPDYSSADVMMGWKFKRTGAGIDSSLAAHVASELKAEAAIAKEARKAKEEQAARRKGQKPREGQGRRRGRRMSLTEAEASGPGGPPPRTQQANCMNMKNSFDGGRQDLDDRWRELFPLPLCDDAGHEAGLSVSARRRRAKVRGTVERVKSIIKILNEMYAPSREGEFCFPHTTTAAQRACQHELLGIFPTKGDPPSFCQRVKLLKSFCKQTCPIRARLLRRCGPTTEACSRSPRLETKR